MNLPRHSRHQSFANGWRYLISTALRPGAARSVKCDTALAQLARVAVAAEKLKRDAINVDVPKEKLTPESLAKLDQFVSAGVEPSLLKIGPISLAPSTETDKSSGLTFHYSPYAVGAYAEGPYTVFVPWTAFQSYLSPQGAAIFGGQRPESDNIE